MENTALQTKLRTVYIDKFNQYKATNKNTTQITMHINTSIVQNTVQNNIKKNLVYPVG